MNARIIFLHALTPIHAGTGQTVAIIDLPVAREKATGWPILPSSSLKGVLRDRSEEQNRDRLYGKPDEAGALCFTDQRLLFFPSRSLYGTFAWTICPLALTRLIRDWKALGSLAPFEASQIPDVQETALLHANSTALAREGNVYLEDLDLSATSSAAVEAIASELANCLFESQAERTLFKERFALVSDEVFTFLAETATEVQARVRLKDNAKTVEQGGLWYEEAVPAEAIFVGGVVTSDHVGQAAAADALASLGNQLIQIGGKSTVGRGLCRLVLA